MEIVCWIWGRYQRWRCWGYGPCCEIGAGFGQVCGWMYGFCKAGPRNWIRMILPGVMRPRLYDGGDRHGLRKRKERGWLIQFILSINVLCRRRGKRRGQEKYRIPQVRVETRRETSESEKSRKLAFTKAIGLSTGVEGEEKTGIARPWKLAGKGCSVITLATYGSASTVPSTPPSVEAPLVLWNPLGSLT